MRILIVEDDEKFRPELEEWLRVNFKDEGIEIESAATVEEGRNKLLALHQRGKQLDAVVLDAKLPAKEGEHEEIDLSLVDEARKWFPDSLLIIYTAYMADVSPLADQTRGVDYRISKMSDKAREELIEVLRERPLLDRLHEIFGNRPRGRERGTRYSAGSHRCVSWSLNTLVSDILRVYDKLSPGTKDEIKRYFRVEKDDRGQLVVKFHN